MTQQEFATLVGVSPRTVQHWESGQTQPTPTAVRRMAAATGRPIAFFKAEVAA